jgi:ATP-binding cassette, subfamily B, bacterial
MEALERLFAGRSVLVVAHRLVTVERADAIVVLQAGRVVAVGGHDHLLAEDPHYRGLVTHQLTAGPS